MSYRIFLSEEAWGFVEQENLTQQNWLWRLKKLSETGDFTETNPIDGRELSIAIVEDYAVTYFFDHAVSEVKVLEIEHADH